MSDVQIVITKDTAGITQAGFGLPLIVGVVDTGQDEKGYTVVSSAEEAGEEFGTDNPVHNMAKAIFAQSPTLGRVAGVVVDYDDTDQEKPDTITAALDIALAGKNDWYFLLCEEQDDDDIQALATWAAAKGKLYVACPDEDVSDTVTLAGAINSDRCTLIYHDDPSDYPDAAWVGKCAPFLPGSITWKFKTLEGIDAIELSTSDLSDLEDADVNTYIEKFGVAQTTEGKSTSGEFVDVVRGLDYIEARMGEEVMSLLISSPKVPFTSGIAQVKARVINVMKLGVRRGIIATDAAGNGLFEVTAPDINDVSQTDKENRHLPDVQFGFTLAGAIHSTRIDGVVSI